MKVYIWDLLFGNCSKGIHKFEQYLIKFTPTSREMNFKNASANDIAYLVETMGSKIYEIRCKHCGIKGE